MVLTCFTMHCGTEALFERQVEAGERLLQFGISHKICAAAANVWPLS